MADHTVIVPERVEARARAALAADQAGLGLKLAAQLPAARAAPLLEWARLLERPAAVLTMPSGRSCKCGSALSHALITDRKAIPEATRKKLELLVGKYLDERT